MVSHVNIKRQMRAYRANVMRTAILASGIVLVFLGISIFDKYRVLAYGHFVASLGLFIAYRCAKQSLRHASYTVITIMSLLAVAYTKVIVVYKDLVLLVWMPVYVLACAGLYNPIAGILSSLYLLVLLFFWIVRTSVLHLDWTWYFLTQTVWALSVTGAVYVAFYKIWKEYERLLRNRGDYDGLTGVLSRAKLFEVLEDWLHEKKPFCIIMLDLDNFKSVNDTYGHTKGDEVLAKIGHIIRSSIRQGDIAGRYGGDEFVVAVKTDNTRTAKKVAERITHYISQWSKQHLPEVPEFGVSYGICCFGKDTECTVHNISNLMDIADNQLYLIKIRKKCLQEQRSED